MFESRRAWRKRPDSGSTIPGLPERLLAITLRIPSFQIRSANAIQRSADPFTPS